jgi:hypothetical protein
MASHSRRHLAAAHWSRRERPLCSDVELGQERTLRRLRRQNCGPRSLENAIAGFEKRQQVEQERLRERERFETDWAQIRTTVVLPALEEVAVVLRKAGWQCEMRAGDKDPGVHFTVYRASKAGVSGGERPFMTRLRHLPEGLCPLRRIFSVFDALIGERGKHDIGCHGRFP